MVDAKRSALVLFAHGVRDAQWSEPFRALQRAVSKRRPDLTVELAFLERIEPVLDTCVSRLAESGHRRITIAPLFLAQGGHIKRDLPRLLTAMSARHPGADIRMLQPIGEVTELLEAIAKWLEESVPR